MKNKALIIFLSWLMVVLSMVIISNFSSETGVESSNTSGGMIRELLTLFLHEEQITDELVQQFQHPIRKLAHFCEFMLLGFCLANAFIQTISLKLVFSSVFAFLGAVIYALFDELVLQGISDNRGPSFNDVLIDSFGCIKRMQKQTIWSRCS